MGVSINWGPCQWMVFGRENPSDKWMITRGTTILGNPHIARCSQKWYKKCRVFRGPKNPPASTKEMLQAIPTPSGGVNTSRLLELAKWLADLLKPWMKPKESWDKWGYTTYINWHFLWNNMGIKGIDHLSTTSAGFSKFERPSKYLKL